VIPILRHRGFIPGRVGRLLTSPGGNGSLTRRPGITRSGSFGTLRQFSEQALAWPAPRGSVPSSGAPAGVAVHCARMVGPTAWGSPPKNQPVSRPLPLPGSGFAASSDRSSPRPGSHRTIGAPNNGGVSCDPPRGSPKETCPQGNVAQTVGRDFSSAAGVSTQRNAVHTRSLNRQVTARSPTRTRSRPRAFFLGTRLPGLAPAPRPGANRQGCRSVCWRGLMASRPEQGS
jgi:hypothetical protein